MAYIPADAKWFLADVVMEIRIEGAASLVHINTLLVRADSAHQAYQEAVKLGQGSETSYQNSDDQTVRLIYRGLRDLNVIYDELEHGAEVAFSEMPGLSEEEIQGLVQEKPVLAVFQDRKPSSGSNYMPKWITEKLKEHGIEEG